MKQYSPTIYAEAFCAAVAKKLTNQEEDCYIKNFLTLIIANGDQNKLKKIFNLTEKIWRQKTGQKKITIESARKLSDQNERLLKKLQLETLWEKKINPDLIAGIKIILDDKKQLDISLAKKLKILFNTL